MLWQRYLTNLKYKERCAFYRRWLHRLHLQSYEKKFSLPQLWGRLCKLDIMIGRSALCCTMHKNVVYISYSSFFRWGTRGLAVSLGLRSSTGNRCVGIIPFLSLRIFINRTFLLIFVTRSVQDGLCRISFIGGMRKVHFVWNGARRIHVWYVSRYLPTDYVRRTLF